MKVETITVMPRKERQEGEINRRNNCRYRAGGQNVPDETT